MSARRRRAFEAHMIECDECWSEVQHGRRGRIVAERGRELAPQRLRELVRASVAAVDVARPRSRGLMRRAAAAAVAVAVGAGALVIAGRDASRAELEHLVADFHGDDRLDRTAAPTLPRALAGLRLVAAERGRVGAMDVTGHVYRDRAGRRVAVYQAAETFPVAEGARHSADMRTWTASVEGAVVFCADRPLPSLVVGDDRDVVVVMARKLGLR